MIFTLRDFNNAVIRKGSFDECEALRLHYLDVAMMKKYRTLSRIYDNRAGAIAFRTALDRRSEEICARLAKDYRRDLGPILKEIAYYRAARPVEKIGSIAA